MPLDSPFAYRFNTNYVAPPDEEAGIKDVIEAQHAIVRGLDDELKEVEEAIAALETRRQGITSKRNKYLELAGSHQLLLSSVLHLPEDVLSRIFTDLAPTPEDWSVGYHTSAHPIVHISHGCSRWREIALSNPTLLTTLSFSETPLFDTTEETLQEFEKEMRQITDMFSAVVSRAAACPINLSLSGSDPGSTGALPMLYHHSSTSSAKRNGRISIFPSALAINPLHFSCF